MLQVVELSVEQSVILVSPFLLEELSTADSAGLAFLSSLAEQQ